MNHINDQVDPDFYADTANKAPTRKTGKLSYSLTNDYMFRAILQENKYVLKGLIAALLHLDESQIRSIEILNPIRLGDSISDREFCLDIHILLNDDTIINLEMQVINHGNWTERSLSYLCRGFDNLPKGADYIQVKPTIHIGFLNFSLPDLEPEFYGSYYMMNEKRIRSRLTCESWCGIRVSYADIIPIRIPAHPRGAYIRCG